jgi:hypothetical protein
MIVEISIVVVSLAVVAIAVATVKAMLGIARATDQVSRLTVDAQQWIGEARECTRETRDAVAALGGAIGPIRDVATRFGRLGERTAGLSAAILDEVEAPIRTAVAVARGVRSVATHLMDRWSERFANGRDATNGGLDNE